MNLDSALEAWRSQDAAPLYNMNREQLQLALRLEQATVQRQLRWEARLSYGAGAMLLAGLAFIFALMRYDDDPRTTGDFIIVLVGVSAVLLWGGALHIGRKTQALRERGFGTSLRHEIERHVALLDYLVGRFWRPNMLLLTALPMFFGVLALWLAIGRVNNLPFDSWQAIWSFAPMVTLLLWSSWRTRRTVEHETLPRKRRLEGLLKEIDGR
jgi:hypothetical protein